jgi:hypothetical protein
MDCPVCFETYHNDAIHFPMLFPCGHTVCKQCRTKLWKCPICQKVSSFSVKNYALMDLIQQTLLNEINGSCPICRFELNGLCAECKSERYYIHFKCETARGVCGHAFHFHCIMRWLKTHQVCPLDKKDWDFVLKR